MSENGTADGTVVVGARFVRTNASGDAFGSEVVSNDAGNAVLEFIPWADADAPVVYFKQIASDNTHEFNADVMNVTLNTEQFTYEVTNAPAAVRTINLLDSNYENLPIGSAEITVQSTN